MAVFHYPVALNLQGRRCVVVGGGAVGARKAQALLEAGAFVVLIAPDANAELIEQIAVYNGMYIAEPFTPSHLAGAFLVIAATDNRAVNSQVAAAAQERNILLNLAAPGDEDEEGDFATMATVRRGDLLIAVTTGGAGPALSARLKRQIASDFGSEWEGYTNLLRELRIMAQTTILDDKDRAAALREIDGRDSIRLKIASGDLAGAREEGLQCLSR